MLGFVSCIVGRALGTTKRTVSCPISGVFFFVSSVIGGLVDHTLVSVVRMMGCDGSRMG